MNGYQTGACHSLFVVFVMSLMVADASQILALGVVPLCILSLVALLLGTGDAPGPESWKRVIDDMQSDYEARIAGLVTEKEACDAQLDELASAYMALQLQTDELKRRLDELRS